MEWGDAYGLEIVSMPLCIKCMCFNDRNALNKSGKHCKLRTMKGIKHKILNPEIGGGVERGGG